MSIADRTGNNQGHYFELIVNFPLRPIHTDKQLTAALEQMDALLTKRRLSQDEKDYLEVLSDLIERYEAKQYPTGPVSDAEMLEHLIEAKGVSYATVAKATGIVPSTLSAVLHGKRDLNRNHISRLATYFNVSASAFAF